jgi:hypothetical protein
MPKFAIGDVVEKDKSNTGVIVAVFTTSNGELRYAVEHEGALEFILETELVPRQTHH